MAQSSSAASIKFRQDQVLTELSETVGPEVMEEIVNNYVANHSCNHGNSQPVKAEPVDPISYNSHDSFLVYGAGDFHSNHFSMTSPEGRASYMPNFYYGPSPVAPNQHGLKRRCIFQPMRTEISYGNYVCYPAAIDQSAYSRQTMSNIQPIAKAIDLSTSIPSASYSPPLQNIEEVYKTANQLQNAVRGVRPKMRIVRKAKRSLSDVSMTTSNFISPTIAPKSSHDFTSFHSPPPTTTSSNLSMANDSFNDSGFSSDNSTLSPITKPEKLQSTQFSPTMHSESRTATQTNIASSTSNDNINLKRIPEQNTSSTPFVHPRSQFISEPTTPPAYNLNRVHLVTEPISPPMAVVNPRVQIPIKPMSTSDENYDPSSEIMRLCKKRPASESWNEASRAKKLRHNEPLKDLAVNIMTDWYESHRANPYPTKEEKEAMALSGNISVAQVKSWFANKRNRNNNTRPKVQKKKMEAKLMNICRQLASDSKRPLDTNSHIINQLSSLLVQARAQSH